MSRKFNKITGEKGENIAAEYLQTHGFQIIDRNWEIKLGEIDIIAVKNNITYFIEVKTQFEHQKTSPIDELTPRKIQTLKKLVEGYSMYHSSIFQKFLLSAVCIWLNFDQNPKKIQWIENLME